ncbi:MAG: CAP domain-containing protein [Acidobacteriota bacterium]
MRSLFCAMLALACASGGAAAPAPVTTEYRDLEAAVVRLVNAHRVRRHLRSLAADSTLARIAREHSREMAERRVSFGHDGFDDRVKEAERSYDFSEIAENVALNDYPRSRTVAVAVDGWLGSRHHLENIEGNFDRTGVGIARAGDGTYYYTQIFIARSRFSERRP